MLKEPKRIIAEEPTAQEYSKAKNKSNWDKKFERYKKAKEAFLKIK